MSGSIVEAMLDTTEIRAANEVFDADDKVSQIGWQTRGEAKLVKEVRIWLRCHTKALGNSRSNSL